MEEKTEYKNKFIKIIDTINEKIGIVVSYFILVIMFITILEAVLRYVFDSPTIWAWDVNAQMFAIIALLAGGYTLWRQGHVRLDVIYSRVSERTQFIFESVSFPLIVIALAIVIWQSGIMAVDSVAKMERGYGGFAPYIWPAKTAFLLGSILIFLQYIANYIRLIYLRTQKSNKE